MSPFCGNSFEPHLVEEEKVAHNVYRNESIYSLRSKVSINVQQLFQNPYLKSQDYKTGIIILLDVVANGRSPFYLVANEVV